MHEAYIRLVDVNEHQQWNSRGHFFVPQRRRCGESLSRMPGGEPVANMAATAAGSSRATQIVAPEVSDDLLALDEGLQRLTEKDPQSAELVKLRYFAGLTIPQAAEILGVSPRKADFLCLLPAPGCGAISTSAKPSTIRRLGNKISIFLRNGAIRRTVLWRLALLLTRGGRHV